MRRSIASAAIAILSLPFISAAHGTTISYNDFSSTTGLQINGNAATAQLNGQTVLRLTPTASDKAGSAFFQTPITLSNTYSFSTAFSFNINNQGNNPGFAPGADGFVFVVQTQSSNVGSTGSGIGYAGITQSVGVKFDTYQNLNDLSANFIGIVTGGNIDSTAARSVEAPYDLSGSKTLYSWIDYNSTTKSLEVRLSDTTLRPTAALLSTTIDLTSLLVGQQVYAGFTSATGGAWENHDILSWQFRDSYSPIALPEPGSLAVLTIGTLGAIGFRRMRRKAIA